MGRRRRDGNHSPQTHRIQWEMKKMDIHFLRNSAMPTKNPQRRNHCEIHGEDIRHD
jgi:hypothetical protein